MKRLFVQRHAKALSAGTPDFLRPLSPEGEEQLKAIIDFLKSKQIQPDLMLSSTALRAQETSSILATGLGINLDQLQYNSRFYSIDDPRLKYEIEMRPNEAVNVLIVGHNPTLTDFVNLFARPMIDNIPTAGLIGFEFDTDDWQHYFRAEYRLLFTSFPSSY